MSWVRDFREQAEVYVMALPSGAIVNGRHRINHAVAASIAGASKERPPLRPV